jgi:vitamin-K-epoxide reductase (warfarin-sensitive)
MILPIFVLALIGFGISLYAYFVEKKIKEDASYKPACDLSDRISCSKPLNSQYGNLFFVSNTVAGMSFYALIALLAALNASTLILVAAIGACILTLYLAYLLYFKIKSLCLVCTSLYVVNFLILAVTLFLMR